jgi:DNA primase
MRSVMSTNSKFTSKQLEEEIYDLFAKYSVPVQAVNGQELNVFCPFHKNVHSAAMYINTKTGLWQCFNPSCGKKGNFRQLYFHLTGKSYGKDFALDKVSIEKQLNSYKYVKENVDELVLDNILINYDNQEDVAKISTLVERGLSLQTLQYFEVGFSNEKNRVVIPVRAQNYKLTGFIGRAIESHQEPRYLYNKGFKRADNLFNVQNAKQHPTCIIVEGSVDCMFVHQAGFPNVIATLGAAISEKQVKMIRKFFDNIIIFSDNDDAGIAMRRGIIEMCRGKNLSFASIPSGLKDPGEMSSNEIQQAINNKNQII